MARRLCPSDLLKVASRGDVEEVTKLLHMSNTNQSESRDSYAALFNMTDNSGHTALHLAIYQRDNVAIQTLVRAGADINFINPENTSLNNNMLAVKYMHTEYTPLMHAVKCCQLPCVRQLIQLGADINCVDNEGKNALMKAVCHGVDCLQLLLEAGADINRLSNDGKNALMLAVKYKDANRLKILIRPGVDLNMQARGEKYDTRDYVGPTALMYAAKYRSSECLKLLLDAGADVNVKTSKGETALHWALTKDYKALCRCGSSFHSDTTECIKILTAYGADVNVQTSEGETALMWAIQWHTWSRSKVTCFSEIAEKLQILIDAGADVNVQTTDGKTALMYSVKCVLLATDNISDSDATACLRLLINSGADIRIRTRRGNNVLGEAIMMALRYKDTGSAFTECVKILMDAEADVTNTSCLGETPLMYAVQNDNWVHILPTLVNAGIVNQQDSDGTTALAYAVSKGTLKCVRWLIDSGASVNICDHQGKSPLHLLNSVDREYGKDFNDRLAKQCLEILLRQETDVNKRDNNGVTPLMYMAQTPAPSTDTMTMLLKHGADLDLVDNRGQTALIHSLKLEEDESYARKKPGNTIFLLSVGANFSKGKLAAGKLDRLLSLDYDLDLIKLKLGKDVSPEITWDAFCRLIKRDFRKILLFLFTNGVMPIQPSAIQTPRVSCYGEIISYSGSPLLEVGLWEGLLGITKYLIATCFFRSADLTYSSTVSQTLRGTFKYPAVFTMIKDLSSQPWPLVKLCFVAVSTTFGASPGRQERVKNSQLPPKLQNLLLFQEPWSRLCVHQWDKIPLTFNPEEYEKLPRPRPLLYHWPVGRQLVPCDCGECDGTLFKYGDEEEYE